TALAFLLAFESKESAIAVPLAVALLGIRASWKEISLVTTPSAPSEEASRHFLDGAASPPQLRRGLAFFNRVPAPRLILVVPFIALGVFTLGLLWHDKTVGLNAGMSPLRYLLIETRVVYTYLRLLVFPYPQSLEYDFHDVGGILPATGIVLILIAGWLW